MRLYTSSKNISLSKETCRQVRMIQLTHCFAFGIIHVVQLHFQCSKILVDLLAFHTVFFIIFIVIQCVTCFVVNKGVILDAPKHLVQYLLYLEINPIWGNVPVEGLGCRLIEFWRIYPLKLGFLPMDFQVLPHSKTMTLPRRKMNWKIK